jgi:uncharacterized membrane protein
MTTVTAAQGAPDINILDTSDIRLALERGLADFRRAPAFGLVFGAAFSAIGIAIAWLLAVRGSFYWVLPLAAGFPLVGPFAAVGLYEVSRRLAAGQPLDWPGVLGSVWQERRRQLPSIAFVALFFYLVWVYMAHLVFALSFGLKPLTGILTSPAILLSPEGLTMLALGTLLGGLLAAALFAVTVIGVPLVVDREIDVVTAMITSVRAVAASPATMLAWGLTVAALSALAMLPLFLGMIVAFPVLGHASWHLYRLAVDPVPGA